MPLVLAVSGVVNLAHGTLYLGESALAAALAGGGWRGLWVGCSPGCSRCWPGPGSVCWSGPPPRPDAGSVTLDGRDITDLPEAARCRIGVSRAPQRPGPFASMTARDTVALAIRRHDGSRIGLLPRREKAVRTRAEELLSVVGLADRAARLGPALSPDERRRLDLAVALACRPRLLLLDEPAAGLAAAERGWLVSLLRTLPARITLLLAAREPDLAFGLADQVSVLHLERCTWGGWC